MFVKKRNGFLFLMLINYRCKKKVIDEVIRLLNEKLVNSKTLNQRWSQICKVGS